MSTDTATFTINSAKVLRPPEFPVLSSPHEISVLAIQVHSGGAVLAIPLDNITEEQVQEIADALQGREISTPVLKRWRAQGEEEASLDDKRVYWEAFKAAVLDAIGVEYALVTQEDNR